MKDCSDAGWVESSASEMEIVDVGVRGRETSVWGGMEICDGVGELESAAAVHREKEAATSLAKDLCVACVAMAYDSASS